MPLPRAESQQVVPDTDDTTLNAMDNSSDATADSADHDIDATLDEITRDLDVAATNCPMGDSAELRSIYCRLELARMDFVESDAVNSPKAEAVMRRFDTLRAASAIRHERADTVTVIINAVLITIYLTVAAVVLLTLTPIRLVHPLLRTFGIRNHFLPVDMMQKIFCRLWLLVAGIRVIWSGLENVDLAHPTIAMFTHASNADPFIVASGPLAFKWIAKRILFFVPLLGWLIALWGHIAIDRSNLEKAKMSLALAVASIHRYGRSIAVSPEGTRSHTGRLGDFKKGPFHTAIAVGLDITPIIVDGNYMIWPPGQAVPIGGTVRVRILPKITIRQGETYLSLMSRVRREMLLGQARPFVDNAKTYDDEWLYDYIAVIVTPIVLAFLYYSVIAVSKIFA